MAGVFLCSGLVNLEYGRCSRTEHAVYEWEFISSTKCQCTCSRARVYFWGLELILASDDHLGPEGKCGAVRSIPKRCPADRAWFSWAVPLAPSLLLPCNLLTCWVGVGGSRMSYHRANGRGKRIGRLGCFAHDASRQTSQRTIDLTLLRAHAKSYSYHSIREYLEDYHRTSSTLMDWPLQCLHSPERSWKRLKIRAIEY